MPVRVVMYYMVLSRTRIPGLPNRDVCPISVGALSRVIDPGETSATLGSSSCGPAPSDVGATLQARPAFKTLFELRPTAGYCTTYKLASPSPVFRCGVDDDGATRIARQPNCGTYVPPKRVAL